MLLGVFIWGRRKKNCLNKTITWHYLPNEAGEEETTYKKEEIITLIQENEALRRVYIFRHVVFDENTLPYVCAKEYQTNIDVSPHLATFVKSFSKL